MVKHLSPAGYSWIRVPFLPFPQNIRMKIFLPYNIAVASQSGYIAAGVGFKQSLC